MTQFKITRGLMELLEDAATSSQQIHKISKPIFKKVTEELFGDESFNWNSLTITLDLLQSIQFMISHHQGCFTTLDSAGLSELLSAIVNRILASLTNNGCEKDLPVFIESCTETIVAIADKEQAAKSKMVSAHIVQLFDLIQHHSLFFKTKLEVLRSVNMLLEQCPVSVKENILEKPDILQKIKSLVEMVSSIGDYEFQVCIIECLMRIFPRKARQKYAEMFIQEATMKKEFLMIRDKIFETDCRLFLNNVNARNDDPTKGVYSFPCVTAYIGTKQLRKPDDPNYEEFWVDFNLGSSRITIFCEQEGSHSQGSQSDESLWETVEISRANIRKYAIGVENDNVSLEFHLKNSLSQLYPSQQYSEQSSSCITLEFMIDLEDHVAHAVKETFNLEKKKAKVSTVEFPLQISVKDQECHEDRRKDVTQTVNSDDQSSQHGGSKRKKVSIPSAPLKLSPDDSTSGSSEQKKDISDGKKVARDNIPQTPSKKTKPVLKVKTPVVHISSTVKKSHSLKSSKYSRKKETKSKTKKSDSKQEVDTVIPETQDCVEDNDEQNKKEKASITDPDYQKTDDCGSLKKKSSVPSIAMNQVLTTKPEADKDTDEGINKGNTNVESTSVEEEIVKEPQLSQHVQNSMEGNKPDPGLPVETKTSPDAGKENINNGICGNPILQEENEVLDPVKDGIEKDIVEIERGQKVEDQLNKDRTNILKRLPKQKFAEVNNFGFDELGDIDTIPESIEPVTDCAASVIEGYNKFCSPENNRKQEKEHLKGGYKHRKGKLKNNNKQGKEQLKNKDEQRKEQVEKVSKNKPCTGHVGKGKVNTSTLSKKMKQTKKTKSFADVDNSLKELCDIDDKENLKIGNQKRRNQETEERKPLSQEEIDNLYAFKDPDIKSKTSKPFQNKNSPASYCVKKYASKMMNIKDHEHNVGQSCKAAKSKRTETKTKKCEKESKVSNDKFSENNTCIGGDRTLRRRKTRPNYIDASETDGNSIYQNEIESNTSGDDLNLSIDHLKKASENGLFSSPDKEMIYKQTWTDSKTKSNFSKENLDAGKIVTVNSDDSDIDGGQNIANQNDNSDSEIGDRLKAEKCEETINESLYVESDDSCNARSYKINCKERTRRSSLKSKEDKQQILSGIKVEKSKSLSRDDNPKIGIELSKNSKKSVSFEDSVLNNISPILKATDFSKTQNVDSCQDRLSHKSKGKATSKDEKIYKKHKKAEKDTSPEISLDTYSRKDERKKTAIESYSKFESKTRPWSKLQELSKTKIGSGYDPFDFEAQADNASNRSERLDRQDMSKMPNEKSSGRKRETSKRNEKKKLRSSKKSVNDVPEISSSRCENTENNPPMLMVQDQQTKRWHRSLNLAKKDFTTVLKENSDELKNQDQLENEENKSSSSSLSPLQIESFKPDKELQHRESCRISEDSDAEQNNSFKKILRDIECRRLKSKKEKTENFIEANFEDTCVQNHDHISPIQTPYLSCASTPKISSGKRKQYTPLNISVIKTPQSAASEMDFIVPRRNNANEMIPDIVGIELNVAVNEGSDLDKKAFNPLREKMRSAFNHNHSPDRSLLFSSDKNGDTSHPSEKSWILSKKNKKSQKKQATYKPRRKERLQKCYKSEESDADSGESEEEVVKSEENKVKMYSEMLRSMIKPCMVHIGDTALASEVSDKNDDSVSSERANSSVIQSAVYTQKPKNLEDVILTPFTPVKEECVNEDTYIDMEQTEDNLSVDLSVQDDENSNFYNSKQKKLTLLGDSGFHSGPSSAVKRLSSSSLKRKYPDINLLEDEEISDTMSQFSDEEDTGNVPIIPKKLFKFDFSAKEQKAPISDAISCSDVIEELSTFQFNSGLPGFLNSFGSDVQRQMERKREQVEAFTKQAVKELQKHHSQNWVVQQQYRSNVDVEYKTKMMLELEALERDIDLLREAGQKTTDLYKFQLDVLHKNHSRQTTSLDNMRSLQSYLKDKSRKVGHHNMSLQNDLKEVLRKDVNLLQKRLIEQTEKDELQNVKRSLQRTFSTSMMW